MTPPHSSTLLPPVYVTVLTTVRAPDAPIIPVYERGENVYDAIKTNARATIGIGGETCDIIYIDGPSLAEIADWLEQSAAAIRAYTPDNTCGCKKNESANTEQA